MTARDSGIARAAGAVVHRAAKTGTEVLLIHRPRYGDWSLPKGGLDTGETYEQAAVREVEEETGYAGELGQSIGAIGYRTRSRQKVVRYWLVEADSGDFVPNKEADAAKWLPIHKARKLATYNRDINLLARAERQLMRPKAAIVHIVRHGNAGQRNAWQKADHLRPLSKKGTRQAATIKARLLKQPIDTVHSSYYTRCDDTVRPLAEALDLDVQHEHELAEESPPEDIVTNFRALRQTTIVMCSHGDVIAGLLGQLSAEGVDFSSRLKWQKGSIWTLELDNGRVIGGFYTPPSSGD